MPDHADLLNEAREAMLDTAALQLRLFHEWKQGRAAPSERATAPAPPPPAAAAAIPDLVFDLARLSLQSYQQWLKITSKHLDGIVGQLRGATAAHTAEAPLLPRIVLEVSGKPGEAVTTVPFRVANPFREPIDVSFGSPGFRRIGDAGESAEPFYAAIEYLRAADPPPAPLRPGENARLAPAEQVTLQARIPLSGQFQSGQQYLGEAYVLSKGRASGIVRIKVAVL
ncbi:MAG: hypothetical protein HY699_13880 [Deltaproteobacteria bacterium]|nr:hypothetical protein [Deltaproteobacteria bacterium]